MTRARVFAIAMLMATAIAIALACGSNSIQIATIEDDGGHAIPCEILDGSDGKGTCEAGFCARMSCGSTVGRCQPIGSAGCETTSYECGCDGITYYNRCVRERAQVSLQSSTQCSVGMHTIGCRLEDGCNPARPGMHAGCGFLFPHVDLSSLGPPDAGFGSMLEMTCQSMQQFGGFGPFPGFCWALPDTCPPSGAPRVQSCPGGACKMDDCEALEKGGLYLLCSPDASGD